MWDGGGRPGGAESPGGTAGSPGGAAGNATAGSGDNTSNSGGERALDGSSVGALVSVSTGMGEAGRGAGVDVNAVSFCLLAFVLVAEPDGAGVAGREDEASDGAFAAAVFFVLGTDAPPAIEPDLCWRLVAAVVLVVVDVGVGVVADAPIRRC